MTNCKVSGLITHRFLEEEAQKPFEPPRVTATAYIEDEQGETINGAYFFTHDMIYQT